MSPQLRDVLVLVAAVAVAFAAGAAWQFTQARQELDTVGQDLATARQDLALLQREGALERLEASAAVATVATQLGDFERGRQLASDFFDLLQAQTATAPPTARAALDQILARRDHIITVLSRGQPDAGSELVTLLTSLQRALGKVPSLQGAPGSRSMEPER